MSPTGATIQSEVWVLPPSHDGRIDVPGGYIAIAVGAFLDFALKVSPVLLGINLHTLGIILISVGFLSVFLPVISNMTVGLRRQRTIIEDDGGYGLRRGESLPSERPQVGKRASRL